MERVTAICPAKLNLTLHITGVSGGYHMLGSLVTTVDVCDTVTVTAAPRGTFTAEMYGCGSEDIPPQSNNAVRAAVAFAQRFNTGGAHIAVHKNIPLGAGMGGSSADAAGVIAAMRALYGVRDEGGIKQVASYVGSDVYYMLGGGWAYLGGKGEEVFPINTGLDPHFIIIAPEGGVSSGECYRAFDRAPVFSEGSASAEAAMRGDYSALCACLHNSLYTAAALLNPDVAAAYALAAGLSPAAGMTGSGSASFAMFPDKFAAEEALKKYNGKFRAMAAKCCLPRVIKGE